MTAMAVAVAGYLLVASGFVWWRHVQDREHRLADIDRRLLLLASAVPSALPEDLHDRATGPGAITIAEHEANIARLQAMAARTGAKYLYTCLVQDGQVRLIASNPSEDELASGTPLPFFYHYVKASPMVQLTATDGQDRHDSYTDEFGDFRSAFVAQRSPGGVVYVAGADYPLELLERELAGEWWRAAFDVVLLGVALLPLLTALLWMQRQHLRRQEQWRRDRENAGRALHQGYREIFNAIPDAIFVHDPDNGRILEVNQATCRLLGWSHQDLLNLEVGAFSQGDPPYTGNEAQAWMRRAVSEGPQTFDWRIRHRDGRLSWVEVHLHQVTLGGHMRILAVARDITERRAAEEQRAQLELELRHSQRLEAMGQLAGGVAHDFNNMLTGILGYGELLQARTEADPALHKAARTIVETAHRAADLTRQLLATTRRGPITKRPFDLHELVGDTLAMLRRTIDRRIAIVTELAEGQAIIDGDAGLVQNAVLNLCLNARDAMAEGGTLTIVTRIETEGAPALAERGAQVAPPRLRLDVSDTGTGMDAAVLARIFDPFFTTKGVGRGTGLGLPAVEATVLDHGGGMTVTSTVGVGSCMTIWLPLSTKTAPGERSGAHRLLAPGNGTVLVIDDEAVVRDVACDLLGVLGYQTLAADGGQAGIALYRERRAEIAAVLLDMIMPDLHGADVARAILAIDPGARILVASGFSRASERQELQELGVRGVIAKPYRMAELSQALQQVTAAVP